MHSFIRKLLSLRFLPAAHFARAVDYRAEKATPRQPECWWRMYADSGSAVQLSGDEDWSVYKQTIRTNNDIEGKEMC